MPTLSLLAIHHLPLAAAGSGAWQPPVRNAHISALAHMSAF